MARLDSFCNLNMGQSPDSSSYNEERRGVPFFQGNADFGEINPTARVWCDAPTKIAHEGDILISVRAPIGALNVANTECCIGRGLASLTVNETVCEKNYLWYAIASKVEELNSKGTGSTFKAISKTVLAETDIPLPNIEKQKQIVSELDGITHLISNHKELLDTYDEMIKSRFLELFGDPVTNEKHLSTKKLADLGILERGRSKHRPRNDPMLLGGKYPLIQTGEISNAGLYVTEYESTYSELGLQQSKMWKAGTLCITIAANIAKTAILTFDACFPDSVVGFETYGSISTVYLHYWFGFFQKILEEQAPQVAQKNINLKILSDLDVILPSGEAQQEFCDFVEQVEKAKKAVQESLDNLEILKKSLMQKYFG